MCNPVVAAVVVGATLLQAQGAKEEEEARNKAAEYNARVNEQNAALVEEQAVQIRRKGETDVKNVLEKGRQIKGQQRAETAASGVLVDSGSAADIITDTTQQTIQDAMTTRHNADMDAWAKLQQGSLYRNEANMIRKTKRTGAFGRTLLTSGTSNALMAYKAS